MKKKIVLELVLFVTLLIGATAAVAMVDTTDRFAAASCGRCGDGQCVKSCGENATSCPQDCGGTPVPSFAGR